MYARRPGTSARDYAASKEFEAEVARFLPGATDFTSSKELLDWWVPAGGYWLDAKEKRQPLTDRWQALAPFVPEPELFVLDELSLRKGLLTHKPAYFLLRDVPGGGRLFITSVYELSCLGRVRANRVGKGKLLFDLRDLRPLEALDGLHVSILDDLGSGRYLRSECLGRQEPGQV